MLFRCPGCLKLLSLADDQAEREVSCPECQANLVAPAAGSESSEPPVAREASVKLRRTTAETEMDMTPMVDMTFLLLIFFMVTAVFTMQKSLPAPVPEKKEDAPAARTLQSYEDDPEFVTVRIDSGGTYHVITADEDVETPSRQELLVQLREARRGNSDGTVPTHLLVVAHGEAAHERVVTALDAGVDVGMEDIQLLTVEGEEE